MPCTYANGWNVVGDSSMDIHELMLGRILTLQFAIQEISINMIVYPQMTFASPNGVPLLASQ
jgi:hypothetical protein